MQTFTAPISGNYKLEVWGAASGTYMVNGILLECSGRGGYSFGYYEMQKNRTIYVSVGGRGENGKIGRSRGGWNGGGDGEWDHRDDEAGSGGGGCTSIQKSLISDGQLYHYESVKNTDVLIVAGGGAGGYGDRYGGGETGSISAYSSPSISTVYCEQASQTSGYAFGQGQSAPTNVPYNADISGAGGGWYGGYTIIDIPKDGWAMAGGGSGHIGTMLTNGATIAGNQTFPKPKGGTETGHSGDGYAIISWISPSL